MIDETVQSLNDETTEAASTVANTAANAADSLNEWVAANPVAATLTSAAVGAGLVALLTLLARDDRPTRRAADAVRESARDARDAAAQQGVSSRDFSELKSQLGDLARRVAAAVPSKADARDAVDSAVDTASQKTDAMWSSVKQEADDLLAQLKPHAAMATDMAKAHPGWTALVIGALGALLGSQLLPSSDKTD